MASKKIRRIETVDNIGYDFQIGGRKRGGPCRYKVSKKKSEMVVVQKAGLDREKTEDQGVENLVRGL